MATFGNWTIEAWTGGYPVWCFLSYEGKEINHIRHTDLVDLQYAVERLIATARNNLPEPYKKEMD
jgi:hypothetical protein